MNKTIMAALAAVLIAPISMAGESAQAPIATDDARKAVEILVIMDSWRALEGEGSVIGRSLDLDNKATSEEYSAAYNANEVAADNTFKDRPIIITGQITGIKKTIHDQAYLMLQGGQNADVAAYFPSDNTFRKLGTYSKGDTVTLGCMVDGPLRSLRGLTGCAFKEDYVFAFQDQLTTRLGELNTAEDYDALLATRDQNGASKVLFDFFMIVKYLSEHDIDCQGSQETCVDSMFEVLAAEGEYNEPVYLASALLDLALEQQP